MAVYLSFETLLVKILPGWRKLLRQHAHKVELAIRGPDPTKNRQKIITANLKTPEGVNALCETLRFHKYPSIIQLTRHPENLQIVAYHARGYMVMIGTCRNDPTKLMPVWGDASVIVFSKTHRWAGPQFTPNNTLAFSMEDGTPRPRQHPYEGLTSKGSRFTSSFSGNFTTPRDENGHSHVMKAMMLDCTISGEAKRVANREGYWYPVSVDSWVVWTPGPKKQKQDTSIKEWGGCEQGLGDICYDGSYHFRDDLAKYGFMVS